MLFLCVRYFIFRKQVIHPVKLSDVVARLAAEDYAAIPPEFAHVDEIGDMAQAIRAFRDNGLLRQRLEQESSSDRAMQDLLSRMTQRMQASDTFGDLTAVIECFIPEAYLTVLAENIGLAVANLRLRDALRAMADPLTGLANRRHLEAVLEVEIAIA